MNLLFLCALSCYLNSFTYLSFQFYILILNFYFFLTQGVIFICLHRALYNLLFLSNIFFINNLAVSCSWIKMYLLSFTFKYIFFNKLIFQYHWAVCTNCPIALMIEQLLLLWSNCSIVRALWLKFSFCSISFFSKSKSSMPNIFFGQLHQVCPNKMVTHAFQMGHLGSLKKNIKNKGLELLL